MTLLPLLYAAPIAYYQHLVNDVCQIEIYSNYRRQTLANRCYIATANGVEPLVIPVEKTKDKTIVKDTKIFNSDNWQTKHFRALESAYSSSAFFDFFKDDFVKIYNKKYSFLLDFNIDIQNVVLRLLNYNSIETGFSNSLRPATDLAESDLREIFVSKKRVESVGNKEYREYYQVFFHKLGFCKNLSILDLLFNMGLESRIYLQK